MKPERWQQVSRLFESAIALEENARAQYLCEQCGTDEALRKDVEKLIASHRDAAAEGFMGSPAVERVASLLNDDEKDEVRLQDGQLLGPYLILKADRSGWHG